MQKCKMPTTITAVKIKITAQLLKYKQMLDLLMLKILILLWKRGKIKLLEREMQLIS